MAMKFRGRQTTPPVPLEATKFESWHAEDIYSALEAQLMGATASLDEYRHCPPKDKPKMLAVMALQMQTAHEALVALRQRVANDKRFQ